MGEGWERGVLIPRALAGVLSLFQFSSLDFAPLTTLLQKRTKRKTRRFPCVSSFLCGRTIKASFVR